MRPHEQQERKQPYGADGGEFVSLTPDQVFDALGNDWRRRALFVLWTREEPMTLAGLADETVAERCDTSVDEVSAEQRKRAATSLHHVHLPKLADNGIVDYDPHGNTVELTASRRDLEPYVDLVREAE